jgi:hypothetical protein
MDLILARRSPDRWATVAALVEQFVQMNNPPAVVSSPPGRAWNDNKRWKKD